MDQNFNMIDVGMKEVTQRVALACGEIFLTSKVIDLIREKKSPKGDILAMAEVAGIMASKKTSELLPLCHQLLLDKTRVYFEVKKESVKAYCEVCCHAKTGVEMEALVGVNIALLTIYDLAKAVEPAIKIGEIYLIKKIGGKSGKWESPYQKTKEEKINKLTLKGIQTSFYIMSDRISKGEFHDKTGPILKEFLLSEGAKIVRSKVLPDEIAIIQEEILEDISKRIELILLSGGTGISKRDITPEAIGRLGGKELQGFGEIQRTYGSLKTKFAWLSRCTAYVLDESLVILFPGSPGGVKDGIEALGDIIPHALKMLRGEKH